MKKDIIKFNSPATSLESSCLIGNGSLGGIVYGGTKKDIISLNIDTLWSKTSKMNHNKKGAKYIDKIVELIKVGSEKNLKTAQKLLKKYVFGGEAGAYMPLADLEIIDNNAADDGYSRSLNMQDGLTSVEYGCVKKEYFCSYVDNVLVLKISGANLSIDINLTSKNPYKRQSDEGIFINGYAPFYTSNIVLPVFGKGFYNSKMPVIKFFCGLSIKSDGIITYGHTAKVTNATFVEIYFTADTTYSEPSLSVSKIKGTLNDIKKDNYDAILQRHKDDFNKLYNTCSFELNDCDYSKLAEEEIEPFEKDDKNLSAIVKLFNYGRYLMISGSRKGSQALNLQGIWQDRLDPPWCSNYTTNINLEMNYWATEQVGLAECVEPLLKQIEKMSVRGAYTAKDTYNSAGWVSGHNSDIWGHASPVCHISFGDPSQCAQFYGCSGWLCLHLYEHYEYIQDIDYLRSFAFPIMSGAVEFYIKNLTMTDNGLSIIPSASPENKYYINGKKYAICKGSTMENSIIKQLFLHYIQAASILNINDDLVNLVKEKLPLLSDIRIGSRGQILEWDKEYDETDPRHRHISHLYANHPAHLINDDTPELQKAVKQSLSERGDDGTGWAIAWKVNQYARLKDGEHAYKLIKRHLRPCRSFGEKIYRDGGTYPNYLCAHPPFQIDGNFGIMSGIAEMLMQSDIDKINILPALPSKWQSGKVLGMVAKGGHIVDFLWENGKLIQIEIKSKLTEVNICYMNKQYKVKTNEKIDFNILKTETKKEAL